MNSYNFAAFQKRPMDKKVRGDFASLTTGSALGPSWGLCPQTRGTRARHVPQL